MWDYKYRSALLFIFYVTLFFLALILYGASAREATVSIIHFAYFCFIPGLAGAVALRWTNEGPGWTAAWALAIGVAIQPAIIAPFWILGAPMGATLAPLVFLLYLIVAGRNRLHHAFLEGAGGPYVKSGALLLLVPVIVAASVAFSSLHAFSADPLERHFVTQATLSRVVTAGYPPANPYVQGVQLSYNYGAHLAMGYMTDLWGLDPVIAIGRIFPLFYLTILAVTIIAVARTVLNIPYWASLTVLASLLFVVGYGPINSHIFGALLGPPNVLTIGPICGLIAFLLICKLISAPRERDLYYRFLLPLSLLVFTFCAASFRGTSTPVIFCALIFLIFAPVLRRSLPDMKFIPSLLGVALGAIASMVVFLTVGSEISGTSFVRVTPTFAWIADQQTFLIAEGLQRWGASATASGAVAFAVIAAMQGGFLSVGFFVRAVRFVYGGGGPGEAFLIGASIAGVFGTMLTTAGGGSNFSFIHYANLSMSLVGGIGLLAVFKAAASSSLRGRMLGLGGSLITLALAIAVLIELPLQIGRMGSAGVSTAFRRPALDEPAELLDLLGGLTSEDRVLYLGPPLLWSSRAWLEDLYLVAEDSHTRIYSTWESPLAPVLAERALRAAQLRAEAEAGAISDASLAGLEATLLPPLDDRYFIIAPTQTQFDGEGSVVLERQNSQLTLYRWLIHRE